MNTFDQSVIAPNFNRNLHRSLNFGYTPMHERYRIFFHAGNDLGLKTRVSKGEAWINDFGLNINGPRSNEILIPKTEIQKVDMFRLHGLGRVIQVDHHKGRLFLSVIRLMIGQFAFINFLRTGKLYRALSGILA